MKKHYLILILLGLLQKIEAADKDLFEGFNLSGEVINPACLKQLQTGSAENTSIIVRSLILEACQESNLAFEGREYVVSEDGTVYYYEDPDDGRTYFGYRPLGKVTDGKFAVLHGGYLGIYRIKDELITYDFLKNGKIKAHVLTKLSESWVPCFSRIEIKRDKMVIHKKI